MSDGNFDFSDVLAAAVAQNGGHFTEDLKFIKQPASTAELTTICTMSELLDELSLSHLVMPLHAESPIALAGLQRPELLRRLKELNVVKLSERQALATTLIKAQRCGRLRLEAICEPEHIECPRCDSGGFDEVVLPPGSHCRIFIISDVHTDHQSNMDWIRAMCPPRKAHAVDVLLCPGDVSDDVAILCEALKLFRARFDEVAFTAGNHDLWIHGPSTRRRSKAEPAAAAPPELPVPADSLEQMRLVYDQCKAIGVRTEPFWIRRHPAARGEAADAGKSARPVRPIDVSDGAPSSTPQAEAPSAPTSAPAQDVLVVPLQSWYHASWDTEPAAGASHTSTADESMMQATWSDFNNCVWPERFGSSAGTDPALAEHFAALNQPALTRLMKVLPARMDGRPPPPTRLDKVATFARLGAAAQTSDLWSEYVGDATNFFTRRHIDGYLAEQQRRAQEAVKRSRRAASAAAAAAAATSGEESTGGTAGGHVEASSASTAAEAAARQRAGAFVVSLSHFVPRQELLPEKRALWQPNLHKVSGSLPLERQLRQLMPDLHVFGHTHLNMDATIDGVRYVQWPLGTPRERKSQTSESDLGMLCVYDGADGGEAPQVWTHWGRHYEEYERDLSRMEQLPYLKRR